MKYRPPTARLVGVDATRWRSWDVAREQGRRTGSPGTLQGGRAATGTRAAGAGWLAVGWPSAPLMGGRAALARAGSAAMAMRGSRLRGRRLRGRVGQNASRCIEEMGMVTLEEREEQWAPVSRRKIEETTTTGDCVGGAERQRGERLVAMPRPRVYAGGAGNVNGVF